MARSSAIAGEFVLLVLTRREAEALYSLAVQHMHSADEYRRLMAIARPAAPPWNGKMIAASGRAKVALAHGIARLATGGRS